MRRTAIRLTPWAFLVGIVLAAALAVSGDTAAAQEQAPADTVGRISARTDDPQ